MEVELKKEELTQVITTRIEAKEGIRPPIEARLLNMLNLGFVMNAEKGTKKLLNTMMMSNVITTLGRKDPLELGAYSCKGCYNPVWLSRERRAGSHLI